MKRALPILIVAVIVIAGLAYYVANKNTNNTYGNNTGNNSTPQTQNTQNQSQNSSSTPQTTDKVTIQNMAFGPADITVKKGTTVTWTNQDSVAHTVVETDGQNGPKSDTLDSGKSYSFTYDTVGTFKYHCSIHPNMTGTVTVTE